MLTTNEIERGAFVSDQIKKYCFIDDVMHYIISLLFCLLQQKSFYVDLWNISHVNKTDVNLYDEEEAVVSWKLLYCGLCPEFSYYGWNGLLVTFYSCITRCSQFFCRSSSRQSVSCHLCANIITLAAIHSPRKPLTWAIENICTGIHIPGDISSPDSPYVCHVPAFSKINQNWSSCSAECDSQSVSPSPPWAGQLSLFFKLKHDLLRILTCDKLYTLLITCQLERWNCAF